MSLRCASIVPTGTASASASLRAPGGGPSGDGSGGRLVEGIIETPLGMMKAVADEHAVRRLVFIEGGSPPPIRSQGPSSQANPKAARLLEELRAWLSDYFEGRRLRMDLPLDPGGTAFQQTVWTALREIPVGTTLTYGALARHIGAPRAVRAVGRANAMNPIHILIPCHRVVGGDGGIGGYAGGVWRKQSLLDRECAAAALRGA